MNLIAGVNAAFVRFLLVGVANTVIGYSTILLFQLGLGWKPVRANAMGYLVGIAVSYILGRSFAFRSKRSHRSGLPAFVAAAMFCFGLNVLVLRLAIEWWLLPAALAQALAILTYTLAFYFTSRYLVFGKSSADGATA